MTDQIDLEALEKFRSKLMWALEEKGFLVTGLTEDGFTMEDREKGTKHGVFILTYYKLFLEGKTIDEIIQMLLTSVPDKSQIRIENCYPLVKDTEFVLDYQKLIEEKIGGDMTDPRNLPLIFKLWSDHEFYVFCGVDLGHSYAYLTRSKFNEFNIDEKQFYDKLLDNLIKKIEELSKESKITLLLQAPGVYSLGISDDFAPSFLLIAHRYINFLRNSTGMRDAEFFYAFVVTTEEILICDPKFDSNMIALIMKRVKERQEELLLSTKKARTIRLEPIIITKNGMTFLERHNKE